VGGGAGQCVSEIVWHDVFDPCGSGGIDDAGMEVSRGGDGKGYDKEVDGLEGGGDGGGGRVVDFEDFGAGGEGRGAFGAGENGDGVLFGLERRDWRM
jgi:hypothetical protein